MLFFRNTRKNGFLLYSIIYILMLKMHNMNKVESRLIPFFVESDIQFTISIYILTP